MRGSRIGGADATAAFWRRALDKVGNHPCCDRGKDCDCPPAAVFLTTLRAGDVGTICETCLDPADAAMLRAMGLRPNATIRICRLGEPTIVEVSPSRPGSGDKCSRPGGCSCRIGLSRMIAQRVKVLVRQATTAP
ncbi:MAG: ferrous iron transport protein A [Phycisphaerales bacterium]|nr:ferrous iron transport protein A [Phycisphaerales bacterium]